MRAAKTLAVVLYLLVFASALVLHAQTSTLKAAWTTADPPDAANSFVYLLRDGGAVVPTGAVSCVARTAGGSSCTLPLTGPLPTAATHSLVLTVSNAFGATDSNTFTATKPNAPAGLTITITVTVS
jgi:hypothetical protein